MVANPLWWVPRWLGSGMQFGHLKRREFITLFGGSVASPLVARAQQPGRRRRIAVLMPFAADEPVSTARLTAFRQSLQQSGWTEGCYGLSVGTADAIPIN
jgi:hypothetical protein